MIQMQVIALAADFQLGKIDKSSLSQQTLMEIFVSGFTNKDVLCESAEDIPDIAEWKGIELHTNGDIKRINWVRYQLQGSMSLDCLPPTLEDVNILQNTLVGSCALTSLPSHIQKLDVSYLSGEIDLCHLPPALQCLILLSNKLSGPIDLTSLPSTLTVLNVGKNKFTGSICITQFPDGMKTIGLHGNLLSGEVDFSCLPRTLDYLFVDQNDFHGDGNFQNLPTAFFLDVSRTQLQGTVVYRDDDRMTINTEGSKVVTKVIKSQEVGKYKR